LAYIHALFYGPEAMHRYLLPRLKHFVKLEAGARDWGLGTGG
jgi:hypothetical protein